MYNLKEEDADTEGDAVGRSRRRSIWGRGRHRRRWGIARKESKETVASAGRLWITVAPSAKDTLGPDKEDGGGVAEGWSPEEAAAREILLEGEREGGSEDEKMGKEERRQRQQKCARCVPISSGIRAEVAGASTHLGEPSNYC